MCAARGFASLIIPRNAQNRGKMCENFARRLRPCRENSDFLIATNAKPYSLITWQSASVPIMRDVQSAVTAKLSAESRMRMYSMRTRGRSVMGLCGDLRVVRYKDLSRHGADFLDYVLKLLHDRIGKDFLPAQRAFLMMTMRSFRSAMYVVVAGSIAPFLQKKQSAILLPRSCIFSAA